MEAAIVPSCLSFPGSDPTLRLLAVLALEAMGPEIVYEQEAHARKLSVKNNPILWVCFVWGA